MGVYSFLAATLLPGGSELALFVVLKTEPTLLWPALAVSTAGNTLGGMFSWWCGHALPRGRRLAAMPAGRLLERWGSPLLLLSWAPVVGDALCLAAGWLRLHWLPCSVFMGTGKFLRYWLLAQGALC